MNDKVGVQDGMRFNGYVYALPEAHVFDWDEIPDDAWETEMVSTDDKRAVQELGSRIIDGARCMVFLCADARVRAITMVAAGVRPQREGHA